MKKVDITHETIEGVSGPCKAIVGLGIGLEVRGMDVVVMARDIKSIVETVAILSPGLAIDRSKIYPCALVHERQVQRKPENDL